MVAHNMPALKPGRTYQLWLVTPDKKISAGTFEPRDGDAMMRATMPLADKLMAIAVTEEPMGGMPQPTGAMVMLPTRIDLRAYVRACAEVPDAAAVLYEDSLSSRCTLQPARNASAGSIPKAARDATYVAPRITTNVAPTTDSMTVGSR